MKNQQNQNQLKPEDANDNSPMAALINSLALSNELKAKEVAVQEEFLNIEKKKIKSEDCLFLSVDDLCRKLKKHRTAVMSLISNCVIKARIDRNDENRPGKIVILKQDFEDFINKIQDAKYPYNFPEKAQKFLLRSKIYFNYEK